MVRLELAGEFAATVLLCQLSYTFREGTWQDSNLRPFEGTVTFTTGETFSACDYPARDTDSSSSSRTCGLVHLSAAFLPAGSSAMPSRRP